MYSVQVHCAVSEAYIPGSIRGVTASMSWFHACTSCRANMPQEDGHTLYAQCLGVQHTTLALGDEAYCDICEAFQPRVSELQALSVHSSCMRIWEDGSRVSLRTNPAFLPKVITGFHMNQSVEMESFHPPPFSSEEDRRLNFLCPVGIEALRHTDQLFVCQGTVALDCGYSLNCV
ncbi:UNVERIFIED_CONTAM: hypothetical protein FKN15_047777 [Acipenser sinensis]